MLAAQAQVGPYRIESLIGRGGMGEVYRARDTRLGRDVAIKVLPAESAADPEFRARAEREARAVAALNHPHICAIHDVGREGSIDYIVFEHIAGETLAAVLHRGPLPLERALEYATQIAGALNAAHRAGVIHRDLKPGNIMIDPSAGVKLLDFGLAKRTVNYILPSGESTATVGPETAKGMVLGTLNYMSPEQAEGKPVDERTDIFSFGAVVYEMIAGRRAFDGESQLSVLSAILRDQPKRIREVAAGIPGGLERIVEHCLEKDPRQRFQHMADLKFSLEALRDGPGQEPSGVARVRPPGRRLALTVLVLSAITLAVFALAVRPWGFRDAPAGPVIRSTIPLPGEDLLDSRAASIALSRDGRLLAFAGSAGGRSRLYLRPVDASDAKPLPGTEDATNPFFSPDGQWVGFFANGKLQKIRVDGHRPEVLCGAAIGRGASWGPDGTIVFNPSGAFGGGLMRVSAAGGAPQTLTRPAFSRDEMSHRWPEFLPDGRRVVFTVWTTSGLHTARLAVLDLSTGKIQTLSETGAYARLAPGGVLAFVRREGLMVSRFDPAALTFAAPPVFTGISVAGSAASGAAQFAVGPGMLVYAAGVNLSRSILVSVDRNGSEQPLYDRPAFYVLPRFSPDGRQVLFASTDSDNFDVWTMDLGRRSPVRITFEHSAEYYAIWEPGGKRVTYSSARYGPQNLFSSLADGTGGEERLTNAPVPQFAGEWSRDGTMLAFTQFDERTISDVWLLKRGGDAPVLFLHSRFGEGHPTFSPDGQWLAYSSNESGADEIYVTAVAGGGKWKVSTGGGGEPVWARSGLEIFFRQEDALMAAPVRTDPFSVGQAQALFRGYHHSIGGRNYDVTSDGQRFVMLKNVDDQSPPKALTLVVNGLDALSRRRASSSR